MNEEFPQKQEVGRNADGTFAAGFSGNPSGRPRGRSMKAYWRTKFSRMSDDEIEEWCQKNRIPALEIWRMGEGNPKTSLDGGEDADGNSMPFTIVNTTNVPSREVSAETLPTPPDPSV